MANLAIVGSHSVNGVSELHTQILKDRIFNDFYQLEPDKFNNKTNGITPRRWLKKANPFLSAIITDTIGDNWVRNLDDLRQLEKYADDKNFQELWSEAKWLSKKHLVRYVRSNMGVELDPMAMFDTQVKRIHEYKRQLLNVLHVITRYNRIKENPNQDFVKRNIIFAGKAAPGYFMAKLIIKLINSVADVVNSDPEVSKKLKVVFLKNYCVSQAEKVIPATELSEQISTAGFEASGTGNMKFMLNGALTIGTLDGANVEMSEEVGLDNIFIFGMKAHEVDALKHSSYNPGYFYETNRELRKTLDSIMSNQFSKNETGIFQPIINSLLNYGDTYCLLADYEAYIKAQDAVDELYKNPELWIKKSILNTARSGKFSSDRTIMEYANEIWKVHPVKIDELETT